ncbi:hypothetical protein [Desulfonema magnum]|uniref:Uncharacterized protein n=1 Tax=Desulfonema magnum TaxID=45655 RepID=A0A975GS17_9BACT|nr:hypothetical protein [Desulfonema magnum]QTA91452.1 Uncharacterized protein dnm_075190 [Desulfonema magnum]
MIGIYVKSGMLDNFRDSLLSLDKELKPTYFNHREKVAFNKLLKDRRSFDSFLKANPDGYFLFSELCRYDFIIYPSNEFSCVFIDFYNKELNEELVLSIFYCGIGDIHFGFSCQIDEYRYRNKIYINLGENDLEAWVGRDLSKYLPGIYWRTFISKEVLKQYSISPSAFPKECIDDLFSKEYLLLRMFDNASQWRENSDKLDELCSKIDGIFSIKCVKELTEKANNYIALTNTFAQWR